MNQLYRKYGKRALDLTISLPLAVALAPVMAATAVVVRACLGSPVLFRQQRPGLHGQPFYVYKFRTMLDTRDAEGRLAPDEERMSAVGSLLRKLSLDELPQLWNVLRGDMSLVGPRPLLMQYLPRYSPEQYRRHEAVPGVTGWAQVNGRNAISWERKFELDVWYVDHCSFAVDLKILALTALKVVSRKGVSASGHATMPEFMGSQATNPAECETENAPNAGPQAQARQRA